MPWKNFFGVLSCLQKDYGAITSGWKIAAYVMRYGQEMV